MTEGSERLERDVGGGRRGEGAAHFRLLPAAHVTFPPRSSRLILVSLRSFLSVIGPSRPHVTLRPSHLLPVGTRRETTSVTREVTRRVTDMEAGWEGSFIAFATRALHAPPTSHKKSEETE